MIRHITILKKKGMLTKKMMLGLNCDRHKAVREKAGVVCKKETYRDWLYFQLVVATSQDTTSMFENTRVFIYTPRSSLSTKWGQSKAKHIFNQSLLSLIELIGLPWVCFIYAIMSLACLAFVVVFIPETKGRSLEQISAELAKA